MLDMMGAPPPAPWRVLTVSEAVFAVAQRHKWSVLNCTGSCTVTLLSPPAAGNGFPVWVLNTGSGTVTVNDYTGTAVLTLAAGDYGLLGSDGAAWRTLSRYVASGGAAGFDPETTVQFYEDFLGQGTGGATGTTAFQFAYPWWAGVGTPTINATHTGGRVDFGGTNPTYWVSADGAATFFKPFVVAKNFTLKITAAQFGSGAGTRWFGLFGAAPAVADPSNGIFFRHGLNGTINAVCRSGGTETTLSTGITAATGTFHNFRAVVTGGGTNVQIFADGVSQGSITTNIPSVNLGPAVTNDGGAASVGTTLDSFFVSQTR